MSALIAKDGTCTWPPTTVGWSRIEAPPITGENWTHAPQPLPRQAPVGFGGFTPEGREQFARCLREGIRRAKAGAP